MSDTPDPVGDAQVSQQSESVGCMDSVEPKEVAVRSGVVEPWIGWSFGGVDGAVPLANVPNTAGRDSVSYLLSSLEVSEFAGAVSISIAGREVRAAVVRGVDDRPVDVDSKCRADPNGDFGGPEPSVDEVVNDVFDNPVDEFDAGTERVECVPEAVVSWSRGECWFDGSCAVAIRIRVAAPARCEGEGSDDAKCEGGDGDSKFESKAVGSEGDGGCDGVVGSVHVNVVDGVCSGSWQVGAVHINGAVSDVRGDDDLLSTGLPGSS